MSSSSSSSNAYSNMSITSSGMLSRRHMFQYRYISFFNLLCSSLFRSRLRMLLCREKLRSTMQDDGNRTEQ
jgi:hypothetical protein